MDNKTVISIINVSKSFKIKLFKKKIAVSDLSLDVCEGKLVGLLGPNGSGKSTTIKMILGFLKPDCGEISVCGYSSREKIARKFIGYLPENPVFQKFLSGREILYYYGKLLGLKKTDLDKQTSELLELVGLSWAKDEKTAGYSKGMTQRLAIAQALINNPPILIFDEPMSGLDPIGRIGVRKIIKGIHERNPKTTIFFSTHIVSDVEELCTDVALLKNGKLSTFCPISDLISESEEKYEVMVDKACPSIDYKKISGKSPLGITFTFDGTDEFIKELEKLKIGGSKIIKISSYRRSLEQVLFEDGKTIKEGEIRI